MNRQEGVSEYVSREVATNASVLWRMLTSKNGVKIDALAIFVIFISLAAPDTIQG
jgi:hypothetical protein